jgi:hypothetical protein
MTTSKPPLPAPVDAISRAVAAAYAAEAAENAEASLAFTREGRLWLDIARELRSGATQAPPAPSLMLHDIEGVVCSHGRVALRRKNSSSALWYVHTDDGSNCADPHAETEHFRRRGNGKPFSVACSLHGGLADEAGQWIDCGLAVCGHEPRDVRPPQPEAQAVPATEAYGTTMADTPAYEALRVASASAFSEAAGGRPESLAETQVLRAVEPAEDRIVDYVKGQVLPPSLTAVAYAKSLRDAVAAGRDIPGAEEWTPETWSRMSSLVGEILTRREQELAAPGSGDRPAEAALVRPYLESS